MPLQGTHNCGIHTECWAAISTARGRRNGLRRHSSAGRHCQGDATRADRCSSATSCRLSKALQRCRRRPFSCCDRGSATHLGPCCLPLLASPHSAQRRSRGIWRPGVGSMVAMAHLASCPGLRRSDGTLSSPPRYSRNPHSLLSRLFRNCIAHVALAAPVEHEGCTNALVADCSNSCIRRR